MLMYLYSFHWESTGQRMQVVHFLGGKLGIMIQAFLVESVEIVDKNCEQPE